MSHLSIETLARLMDEAPNASEAAHLDLCADCRLELEGLKADAAALAELPDIAPPATQWHAIEDRLRAEGLIRTQVIAMPRRWLTPVLQLAAAIVIFVLGGYVSTTIAAARTDTRPVATAQTQQPSVPSSEVMQQTPAVAVSNIEPAAPQEARTVQEAQRMVRNAELQYLSALSRYTELAGGTQSLDPLARLAALESIVLTTRAALGQAPADPVINGYHLTAMAQRDATLKQLSSANDKTWF